MRTFFIVWGGQLISVLGTGLTQFGIFFFVFAETDSVTSLAVVILAASIPAILIGPIAGTIVDRIDRRWAMIASDSVAGMASIALAILWMTGNLELWHIVVTAVISSIGQSFQEPAYMATIPLIVPKDQLNRANGMVNALQALGIVVAPVLAGVLIVTVGLGGILIIDVVTFAAAVVTLLIVRFPRPESSDDPEAPGNGSLLGETVAGFRYLKVRSGLLVFLFVASVLNFLLGFTNVLTFPLILSFTNEAVMGTVLSSVGVAMLVGSIVSSTWKGPEHRIRFILGMVALGGIFIGLSGGKANAIWIAGWMIAFMFMVPIVNATSQSLWQLKIAPDYQGRVFSVRRVIATMASPVAYALAGPLADNVFEPLLMPGGGLAASVGDIIGTGPGRGIGFMYVLMGALLTVTAVAGFMIPRLRNVERDIPDAIPDTPRSASASDVDESGDREPVLAQGQNQPDHDEDRGEHQDDELKR